MADETSNETISKSETHKVDKPENPSSLVQVISAVPGLPLKSIIGELVTGSPTITPPITLQVGILPVLVKVDGLHEERVEVVEKVIVLWDTTTAENNKQNSKSNFFIITGYLMYRL